METKIVKVVWFFIKLKYTGKPLSKERKHNTTEKMVTKQNKVKKVLTQRKGTTHKFTSCITKAHWTVCGLKYSGLIARVE